MAPLEWLVARMLQTACAQAREESARAAELMRTLAGKRLAIRVLGTPWAVDPILIESDGSTLVPVLQQRSSSSSSSAATEVPVAPSLPTPQVRPSADATLIGAPLALLALAGTDPEAPIRRGDVRIEGDAELAQQYRELAAALVPDLENALGRLMGRSAAHLATRAARNAAGVARNAAWNSMQNLAEYLAHESGDLVSRHEAEHFLRGVDELRERADRLDARLSDLESRAQVLTDATGPQ